MSSQKRNSVKKSLSKNRRGATMVEYAVTLACVASLAALAVKKLGYGVGKSAMNASEKTK